ncbi:MAG TPA: tyrosine-type recombinase/integrase [Polyangiaceae bacterium]|nr:tyrosine-type recombinase/integrase [Polyangiaceae bacterium]
MTSYVGTVKRPVRTMTDVEIAKVLRVSGEHRDGFRDHVIISLALSTGLREHEIVALNVGDVSLEGVRCKRHVKLRVYKRSSKDPALQEITLSDGVRAKIEKLLHVRTREEKMLSLDAPLFVSRCHKRLSTRQLRRAFKVWQERAGLERRFNLHATRHTAVTWVYRRTHDIRLTQRFARHTSIESTMIYTHSSDEDLLRAVQEQPY